MYVQASALPKKCLKRIFLRKDGKSFAAVFDDKKNRTVQEIIREQSKQKPA
jgi:hypothetical protein